MNKSKRVFFYLPMLGQGGIERVVHQIIDRLADRVTFGVSGQAQQDESILSTSEFRSKCELLPAPGMNRQGNRYLLYHVHKLKQYLDVFDPDVVFSFWHLPNLVTGIVLSLYASSRRPRWVMSVHGESPGFDETKGYKWKALSLLLKKVARISSGRITVSASLVPRCEAYFGQRFELFYNPAVDASMSVQAEEDPGHPWLRPGNNTIISIGRVDQNKDYPTMIRAFEITKKIEADAKLLILGDGPLRDEMQDLVKTKGLEDSVELVGYVANPYSYLSRCSMFVLTSMSEASPMVLAEAMYFDKPVVCSDFFTAPDFVEDGVNGLLAPRRDAENFAAKMLSLFADKEATACMVENAKKMVVDRHDVTNATRRYYDLISRL